MSYEGREFFLCEDGHLTILDSSRQESKNERWKLEKGGEQILTGTYAECMLWLTRHCPHPILQSALERGYHIEPTTVGGNPPCKSVSS